ncbi:MAG: hypothetical protein K6E99_01500 [Bacilli bacterium]|nr:hypothetical protein [Bacilli bacterium]
MNDYFKECCDTIVANSCKPIRVSKSSIIKRKCSKKDAVIMGASEELLGNASQLYLIPPEEQIEIMNENTIETSTNEGYDIEKEVTEMSVGR